MELNLPIDRGDLPPQTYCVGGWVRDALLGRARAKLDIDFVMPSGSIEKARQIATKYGGGFVILDREREIARVVLPQGNLDFAKQVGDSLRADLNHRDFAMNAIAWSVHEPEVIIDPHNGRGDIAHRRVRMISPENIKADPLRVLRAYRQAAQLNFTIEFWTKQTIQQLAPLLTQVAMERIRMELGYLLQCPSDWLINCIKDGIFSPWLETSRLKLDRLRRIEPTIGILVHRYPALSNYFKKDLVQDHPVANIIKYSALVPQGTMLDFLGLSRLETKWANTLLRYLPQIKNAENSDLTQYYLFDRVGDMLPALFALALADEIPLAWSWLDRWLDPADLLAHPANLISGDDLKSHLGIKPSPKLGELLRAIREAQIQQIITDRAGALEFAQQWWEKSKYPG